jgi:hypothetical protein
MPLLMLLFRYSLNTRDYIRTTTRQINESTNFNLTHVRHFASFQETPSDRKKATKLHSNAVATVNEEGPASVVSTILRNTRIHAKMSNVTLQVTDSSLSI